MLSGALRWKEFFSNRPNSIFYSSTTSSFHFRCFPVGLNSSSFVSVSFDLANSRQVKIDGNTFIIIVGLKKHHDNRAQVRQTSAGDCSTFAVPDISHEWVMDWCRWCEMAETPNMRWKKIEIDLNESEIFSFFQEERGREREMTDCARRRWTFFRWKFEFNEWTSEEGTCCAVQTILDICVPRWIVDVFRLEKTSRTRHDTTRNIVCKRYIDPLRWRHIMSGRVLLTNSCQWNFSIVCLSMRKMFWGNSWNTARRVDKWCRLLDETSYK